MTIREAIKDWLEQTGGTVKQNAGIATLTKEFRKRLQWDGSDDVFVNVYACKPSCSAAALYVAVSLAPKHQNYLEATKLRSTRMKVLQFDPAERSPGGKKYTSWRIMKPSTKLDLYYCEAGQVARTKDFTLADYVKPMADYLSMSNQRLKECCHLLTEKYGEDFLEELQTEDGFSLKDI